MAIKLDFWSLSMFRGPMNPRLHRVWRFIWLRTVHPLRLIYLVTLLDEHNRYTWYLALRPRNPWLALFRPPRPATNAPWLNAEAIAYRRGIGRKEPFLG